MFSKYWSAVISLSSSLPMALALIGVNELLANGTLVVSFGASFFFQPVEATCSQNFMEFRTPL